jgi:hypothetical protein
MKRDLSAQAALRGHLLLHLSGKAAHIPFSAAIRGFPFALAGERPPRLEHTAWGLVFHLRLCQRDILDYALREGTESPDYPSGLWPKEAGPSSEAEWRGTIAAFKADLAEIEALVGDPGRDLFAPMRPGLDESLLEMASLVIDHNSYHLGQLVDIRMLLGVPVRDW